MKQSIKFRLCSTSFLFPRKTLFVLSFSVRTHICLSLVRALSRVSHDLSHNAGNFFMLNIFAAQHDLSFAWLPIMLLYIWSHRQYYCWLYVTKLMKWISFWNDPFIYKWILTYSSYNCFMQESYVWYTVRSLFSSIIYCHELLFIYAI